MSQSEPQPRHHPEPARLDSRRAELRARRHRRAMLRLDVAIGAVAALVTILVAPGIALAAIIAVLVLIVAGVWLLVERRRRRGSRRRRRLIR